jgi:hypothetical protein
LTSNNDDVNIAGAGESTRYLVYACLTPSGDEPSLQEYFEDRAGTLVRELAASMAAAVDEIASPEGFADFFASRGVSVEALGAGLHSRRVSELLSSSIKAGANSKASLAEALAAYLVDDFALLESWIVARKGSDYRALLFGVCRPVPFFEGERFFMPAAEYLARYSEDFLMPFSGILVDSGVELRISKPEANTDAVRLRRIISFYPDYNIWVLAFWS